MLCADNVGNTALMFSAQNGHDAWLRQLLDDVAQTKLLRQRADARRGIIPYYQTQVSLQGTGSESLGFCFFPPAGGGEGERKEGGRERGREGPDAEDPEA